MKRLGGVWQQLVSFENLLLAFGKARRGKSQRPPVAVFECRLEKELLQLQRELQSGAYQPGAYRLFTIYERKPRLISAAPFRDRVVHHAIMNVIEPQLDRSFIDDSYACRPGKGTHAAVNRYQHWAKRYRYALKMDIARYFPSIDHSLLKQKLRYYLKDQQLLALLDGIIDSSQSEPEQFVYFPGDDLLTHLERPIGIPIGNLTSQFFANLYLDDFDHFVKEELKVKAYLRYVDDMVMLDDDKSRLAEWRLRCRERLEIDRLKLHPRKAHITPVCFGIDLLGYRVLPEHRRLRNDNGHRFVRKLRRLAAGYAQERLTCNDIAKQADTLGLRKKIFSGIVYQRGRT
jgi:RNA-directed DNA polymerase